MSQQSCPNQHDPNRLLTYIEIHSTVLEKFKTTGFVGDDTLEFQDFADGIRLNGEIACLGEIVIEVDKFIEIIDGNGSNPLVQTQMYKYHALVRGSGNIFRYDNLDDNFSFRPGHLDIHHKHVFNWETGMELPGSPIWVGECGWPRLDQVIQEVSNWYWDHYSELTEPDLYGEIGLRSGSRQVRRSGGGSPSLEL